MNNTASIIIEMVFSLATLVILGLLFWVCFLIGFEIMEAINNANNK